MNGAYWRGHMTIGGLPSPHSLTGFLRYFRNVSQRWPVSWMAPTCSICQEMVSIYLIKIKITTKFFKFVCQFLGWWLCLLVGLSVLRDGVSVGLFFYKVKTIPWILSYKWAYYWP